MGADHGACVEPAPDSQTRGACAEPAPDSELTMGHVGGGWGSLTHLQPTHGLPAARGGRPGTEVQVSGQNKVMGGAGSPPAVRSPWGKTGSSVSQGSGADPQLHAVGLCGTSSFGVARVGVPSSGRGLLPPGKAAVSRRAGAQPPGPSSGLPRAGVHAPSCPRPARGLMEPAHLGLVFRILTRRASSASPLPLLPGGGRASWARQGSPRTGRNRRLRAALCEAPFLPTPAHAHASRAGTFAARKRWGRASSAIS